jgi:hypothetical protein
MPYGVPNHPVVFQRAFAPFGIHLSGMWGRIRGHEFTGIETLDESPCLKAWLGSIKARLRRPGWLRNPQDRMNVCWRILVLCNNNKTQTAFSGHLPTAPAMAGWMTMARILTC